MNPSRLSPRGTSLIEAMAALVVFSVGILGVMQMNVLASRQNNLARTRTTASRIARDVADSIERLPFDHPALSVPTSLLQEDADFGKITNTNGLVTLASAVAQAGQRPILGSADAIFASEGEGNFYTVAWRALPVANPERNNAIDQVRILVMVAYPSPLGVTQQVNTWAIKTNPKIITGDNDTILEF